MVSFPSAKRDETKFDEAFQFDLTRSPNGPLGFGHCVSAQSIDPFRRPTRASRLTLYEAPPMSDERIAIIQKTFFGCRDRVSVRAGVANQFLRRSFDRGDSLGKFLVESRRSSICSEVFDVVAPWVDDFCDVSPPSRTIFT